MNKKHAGKKVILCGGHENCGMKQMSGGECKHFWQGFCLNKSVWIDLNKNVPEKNKKQGARKDVRKGY